LARVDETDLAVAPDEQLTLGRVDLVTGERIDLDFLNEKVRGESFRVEDLGRTIYWEEHTDEIWSVIRNAENPSISKSTDFLRESCGMAR